MFLVSFLIDHSTMNFSNDIERDSVQYDHKWQIHFINSGCEHNVL